MLQLIYVSSKSPSWSVVDLDEILSVSQAANRRDGITGLLYSDGKRFLQVVEGPAPAIEKLLRRLAGDPRHRAMVTLSRRDVAAREFGDWSMARMRPEEDHRAFSDRIRSLCRHADPRVVGTFLGLVEARAAARA